MFFHVRRRFSRQTEWWFYWLNLRELSRFSLLVTLLFLFSLVGFVVLPLSYTFFLLVSIYRSPQTNFNTCIFQFVIYSSKQNFLNVYRWLLNTNFVPRLVCRHVYIFSNTFLALSDDSLYVWSFLTLTFLSCLLCGYIVYFYLVVWFVSFYF